MEGTVMGYPIYTNTSGTENVLTSWPCLPLSCDYGEIDGWEAEYRQTLTLVTMELPARTNDGEYWTRNSYITSLQGVTSRFTTAYDYLDNDYFKVFLNGNEIPSAYIGRHQPDNQQNGFVISSSYVNGTTRPEGYLWVSYIPSDSTIALGDMRDSHRLNGIRSKLLIPYITPEALFRMRSLVNHLESYLDVPPSLWSGGEWNTSRSLTTNLLPSRTPIFYAHLSEVAQAITFLEARADSLSVESYTRYQFSTVGADSKNMIGYTEELMEALSRLETFIINYISGKVVS